MKRMEVVNTLAKAIGAERYLEIGVENGFLLQEVRIKERIAVDPCFIFSLKRKVILKWQELTGHRDHFFEIPSDDFFAKHTDILRAGLDLAFVDGLHTAEQAMTDVENCLKHMRPGGIILLHDCNPRTKAIAWPAKSWQEACGIQPEGWSNEWSGDVWKTAVALRSREDLDMFTLDCDYGIGVICKQPNSSPLEIQAAEAAKLTFDDFAANREKLLNLKQPEYLFEFAENLRDK